MTLQELMSGSLQAGEAFSPFHSSDKTASRIGTSGSSSFIDIFNGRIGSYNRQYDAQINNYGRIARNQYKDVGVSAAMNEGRAGYRTFREAISDTCKANASDHVGAGAHNKSKACSISCKLETNTDKAAEKIRYLLMQILGLDMRDLQKLINEAGVKAPDFTSVNGISRTVADLSRYLGLDADEQSMLEKILQFAVESATLSSSEIPKTADPATNFQYLPESAETNVVEKGGEISNSSMQAGTVEIKQAAETAVVEQADGNLALRIRKKLDEYAVLFENGQDKAEKELRSLIEQLLDQSESKAQAVARTGAETPESISDAALDESNDPQLKNEAPVAADEKRPHSSAENLENVLKNTFLEQAQVQQHQPVLAEMQGKADGVAITQKPPEAVQPEEILSQVIKNAKVIISSDKSEMVMDLKPDSLGEISLKVVSENGIVMAKFVAESQQVKQILETNMQMLKDSLEKQGVNVQGFSVSVKKDSDGSAGERHRLGSGRGIKGVNPASSGMDAEGLRSPGIAGMGKLEYYRWAESSTIDLTA